MRADVLPRRPADLAAVRAARGWLGTPYRHQGSRRGVGCDCLGLLRGVWRELLGPEPEAPPPYAADWAELRRDDPLMEAAMRRLVHDPGATIGAVLLFRWSRVATARHCGVLVAPDRMIHAYAGHGVVESPLTPSWRRRIVGRFLFPAPGSSVPNPHALNPSE